MTRVLRLTLAALGLLVALPASVFAADAMTTLDDFDVHAAIILQCHPSQSAADRAYLANGDAIRRAALTQLQAQLDKTDPAHRADNAKKAAATLDERRAGRDFDISEQARNYGCAWLDGQLNVTPK